MKKAHAALCGVRPLRCKMEEKMPLETRSVPRQIVYLVLALIGLLAVLDLLAHWQL